LHALNKYATEGLSEFTQEINEDPNASDKFSMSKCLRIRNLLMKAASSKVGNRSTEILNASLQDVRRSLKLQLDGSDYHVVRVKEQKTHQTGDAADLVFTSDEFEALNLYISCVRPKILKGRKSSLLFMASKTTLNAEDVPLMAYSTVTAILDGIKTQDGRSGATRVVRQSRITNIRNAGVSLDKQFALAKSMNHSWWTAANHYDFSDSSSEFLHDRKCRFFCTNMLYNLNCSLSFLY